MLKSLLNFDSLTLLDKLPTTAKIRLNLKIGIKIFVEIKIIPSLKIAKIGLYSPTLTVEPIVSIRVNKIGKITSNMLFTLLIV